MVVRKPLTSRSDARTERDPLGEPRVALRRSLLLSLKMDLVSPPFLSPFPASVPCLFSQHFSCSWIALIIHALLLSVGFSAQCQMQRNSLTRSVSIAFGGWAGRTRGGGYGGGGGHQEEEEMWRMPALLKSPLGSYDSVRLCASSSGSCAIRNVHSTDTLGIRFSKRFCRNLRGHINPTAEFGIDMLNLSSCVTPSRKAAATLGMGRGTGGQRWDIALVLVFWCWTSVLLPKAKEHSGQELELRREA